MSGIKETHMSGAAASVVLVSFFVRIRSESTRDIRFCAHCSDECGGVRELTLYANWRSFVSGSEK